METQGGTRSYPTAAGLVAYGPLAFCGIEGAHEVVVWAAPAPNECVVDGGDDRELTSRLVYR